MVTKTKANQKWGFGLCTQNRAKYVSFKYEPIPEEKFANRGKIFATETEAKFVTTNQKKSCKTETQGAKLKLLSGFFFSMHSYRADNVL